MKKNIAILYTCLFAVLAFVACDKVDDLPFYGNGNAVVLSANPTSVTPTAADSTKEIVQFNWTTPKYEQDTSLYKYVLEVDSTGRNFSAATTTKILTKDLHTAITGRQLNTILLNYGYALGVPVVLDARVISSYGNNNEAYASNVVKISVTPYADPSTLVSSKSSVTTALATAANLSNTFTWSPSFSGYAGTISYVLQYDSVGKNFANLREVPTTAGAFKLALTEGEMNEMGTNVKIPAGNTGTVAYRIKATTASGAIAYSNTTTVSIATHVSIVRLYLPGGYQGATGNGNDWDPSSAPELIRDLRPEALNDLYYTYIYLPAGAEFKITQGRGWDINYGGSGTNSGSFGGDNFKVTNAGVYRISGRRKSMKYDIREGRMGFVGGATNSGWDPPSVFPANAMGLVSKNLFVGLHDFSTGGWKLIDNGGWNNSDITVTNTRSYGTPLASGSTMEVNGSNFADISTAGRRRIIWDGRDPNNIKYEMSPATEMRVVGDGMDMAGVGDWNPGSSPQMTYKGSGVWEATVTLKANKSIKFLAGNDWGAFDYEDAGNAGSTASETKRAIKWEGGDNFSTPATAGTYTITLNEHTGIVTIK